MMHKGKGGKGKKGKGKGKNWTSWAREVGTQKYLKNFRKGLRWQLERAVAEMVAAPDDIVARDRWYWVITKRKSLSPRNGHQGRASHAGGQADAVRGSEKDGRYALADKGGDPLESGVHGTRGGGTAS